MALLLALLGMTAVAFRAYQTHQSSAAADIRRALWITASAEVEFHKLQLALARFVDAATPVHLDNVRLRFDIFWGRLEILTEAREATVLAVLPNYEARVRNFTEILRNVEPLVDSLRPESGAAARVVTALLEPIDADLHAIFSSSNGEVEALTERAGAAQDRTYLTLLACLFGVLAISALLIALQVRDIRIKERLLADMTASMDELRRHRDELRQATLAATDAKQAAEDANLAKSFFLANMSHELRTPLNAILGFSEIMTNQVLGPIGSAKYHSYAKDIYGSARHLIDISNDILTMTRIEAGKLVIDESDVGLAEIATFAANILKVRMGKALLRFDNIRLAQTCRRCAPIAERCERS